MCIYTHKITRTYTHTRKSREARGGAFTPYNNSRAQEEKEQPPLLAWKECR